MLSLIATRLPASAPPRAPSAEEMSVVTYQAPSGLASAVGCSRAAFARRFQLLVGQPPMQYLTNWRMQCGAKLLREGHANVASIALDVGYDSEAAFSRAFKRATGMPPATWRKAQKSYFATA